MKLQGFCKWIKKMKCEVCDCTFEYDEGKTYDDETFVCFECADELVMQSIEWQSRYQ